MSASLQDTEEMRAVVGWLSEHAAAPVGLAQVFAELGLEELGGNYTDTELPHGDAFLLAAAVAAVAARAKKNSDTVDLSEWNYSVQVTLHSDVPRLTQLATAMKYFALDPEEHRVAQRWGEDTVTALADEAEALRGRLD
ncbi:MULTISPECIES: imm68 putative immunity domain-containing protein [unclassified Corynebacterium]|uniref:imm68 putative immunity domain-containing protein n=1 Tax=unclassified Corynebacterium TaxID=2624378 RepID=UPI0029CA220B|nr:MULTISPECIES: imm68 putative immunity domain-containing protein [unclassified Corynebacterium]WPF66562.1 imm68 putative immunity domain-containing protein [Corynebacterium sp. 22KM0430]WPF69051.1 imm68 putative immunity domain-containing protein [Corynebacterium sp. 21KM1197]